ncbi:MAG: hypothetical protein ILA52_01845 [Alphaproteobacteria bacterium]|nr:hypothetical protein [Alphaproteobacteria bacterium]
MGWLASIPFLSAGGGILGITFSLLSVTLMLGLWALVLMILHPLHATIFLLSALFEYVLIHFFGFNLWLNFFSFFGCYILLFVLYSLFLRKILPLPKSDIEHLIKLSELKKEDMLSDEEYKAAKKRLLKL